MQEIEYPCDKVWIEKNIDISWTLVSYTRKGLGVPVSPTIGTTFIYLHNFFANNQTTKYPLYMLLVSALSLSCKVTELYRSIDMIFSEFAKTTIAFTAHVPEKVVFQILGGERDFHQQQMSQEEKNQLFNIEVELLDASNWVFSFPLPFDHMSLHGNIFQDLPLSEKEIDLLGQCIIRDLSQTLKLPRIVQLDSEVVAAAAIENASEPFFKPKGLEFSSEIRQWIEYAKTKNNKDFNNVSRYLQIKMQKFY